VGRGGGKVAGDRDQPLIEEICVRHSRRHPTRYRAGGCASSPPCAPAAPGPARRPIRAVGRRPAACGASAPHTGGRAGVEL
jgi:hypothetical protein